MKRFTTTGIALLLMGGGLSLTACVTPGTITVTTTADTVADDDLTSLREAFAMANQNDSANTIVLATGATYDLTDCTAGALVHTRPSALTITGNDATVHQTCTDDGIMASTRTTSSLVISHATLTGGPNSGVTMYGAGINVRGSLVLEAATVSGVDAGPGGTVVEGNIGGPEAIDIRLRPSYSYEPSSIAGNTGAAIHVRDGGVQLDGAQVERNLGDGLRLDGTSTLIADDDGVRIRDNAGWGIYIDGVGSSRMLTAAYIERNALGGIYCSGCARLDVSGGSISGNGSGAAEGGGGGIVFLVDQDDPTDAPALNIQYASISSNRARRAGGGIFVGPAGPSAPNAPRARTLVSESIVIHNRTEGDNRPGGGIAVTAGNLWVEQYSTISSNSTLGNSDGGAIYFRESPGNAVVGHYSFIESRTTFELNRSGRRGGALFVDADGSTAIGRESLYESNSAAGDGGGVYVTSRTATPFPAYVYGSFFDNTAGGRGGGAYVEVGQVEGNFRGNHATQGGGLFVQGQGSQTETTVSGTFNGNLASVRGGGVAVERSPRFLLGGATVTANSAPVGGGLWIEGSLVGDPEPARLIRSTIVENLAPVGSGVAVAGGLQTDSSLIVRPLGGGFNCTAEADDLVPAGWSWVSDTTCGVHPNDTVSTEDPLLLPLEPDPDRWDYLARPPRRAPAWTSPVGGMIPADVCDERLPGYRFGAGCEPGAFEIWEPVRIDGTAGPDDLVGTPEGDYLRGFEGDDVIRGEDGYDQLDGGPGDDWLLGGQGNDILLGGDGDDVLIAGEGDDAFDGGQGNDRCLPAGAPELTPC